MVKFLLWCIVLIFCWPLGLLVGLCWILWMLLRGTAAVVRGGAKAGAAVLTPQYEAQQHDWEPAQENRRLF